MPTLMPYLRHLAIAAASMLWLTATPACSSDTPDPVPTPDPDPEPEQVTVPYAKGADVSWVTQQESEGIQFFSRKTGRPTELMQLLRDECGVNAVRLRVWVNPADGWNGLQDLLVKARRAKALGLELMIDFHLSDSWADPSQQTIPAAWKNLNIVDMHRAVSEHITSTLQALKAENIVPAWVQVGNETRNGMLWPIAQADLHPQNFAELITTGYDAVKAVFPNAQVIVHVDCGHIYDYITYIFGILQRYNARYDMIGVSIYPDPDNWMTETATMMNNLRRAHDRYGKPTIISEIGMSNQRTETMAEVLEYILTESQLPTMLDVVRGVFYWEPQAPNGYNGGYDKGCFTPEGTPSTALDPFLSH